MDTPLRLGVIGLGRLWEARHKPSLARIPEKVRVTCVYDQVARRARLEAGQLKARAAASLTEMIEASDVDALYVLGPQWFGWHPVDLAARAGKPVYAALPFGTLRAELEAAAALAPTTGFRLVPEMPRRFYPATLRLRELLATRLGRPRLILGTARVYGFDRYGDPGPTNQIAPTTLVVDPGANLIDWCRFIFQSEPESITHQAATVLNPDPQAGPDFEGITLRFPDGALAQLTISRYHQNAWGEAGRFLPGPGFQVFAERGVAWLEMPDRIQWTDAGGRNEERMPLEPTLGEVLADHFRRALLGEPSLAPTLDDALTVARAVEQLRSPTP